MARMRRPPVYSSSRVEALKPPPDEDAAARQGAERAATASRRARWRGWIRHPNAPWAVTGLLFGLVIFLLMRSQPLGPSITQKAIDDAVLHTLSTQALPSAAARAYEAVIPSVVRVTALVHHPKTGEEVEHGVGTGVVIVDQGVILTNLHVVAEAHTLKVDFFDGSTSTASLVGAQPQNDLAVLQAHQVPDDLIPATMISTADLRPGDQVVAIGHPFGIGPSVSAGVVSGLKRSFESPDGEIALDNLIQFDAAANPGNSGGPLATLNGEVVGIVTAIYSPNQQRTFVGIGFAVPIESAAQAAGLPPF